MITDSEQVKGKTCLGCQASGCGGCGGSLEQQQQQRHGDGGEKGSVRPSPAAEQDLLRSVLAPAPAPAQAANALRPSLTVRYQHSPPLQAPGGERSDVRALEGKVGGNGRTKGLKYGAGIHR